LTRELTACLRNSEEVASRAPQRLANASAWLHHAEAAFAANAYSPFWDALERAGLQLRSLNDDLRLLAVNRDLYYTKLDGEMHTFPRFPDFHFPDPTPVIEQLCRLERMGQTNHQFASIWEERATRSVLLAGFATLQEGLAAVGTSLAEVLERLSGHESANSS
jgi:hypothetical protein